MQQLTLDVGSLRATPCEYCGDPRPRKDLGRYCSRSCGSAAARAQKLVTDQGRRCSRCLHWKPWSAFAIRNQPDAICGRVSKCFYCNVDYSRVPVSESRVAIRQTRACLLAIGRNRCGSCNTVYDLEMFQRGGGDRRSAECSYCGRARRFRNQGVLNQQGLALSGGDLLRMYLNQDGKCACCGDAISAFGKSGGHVHHDHDTLKVVDWLCHFCNLAEGLLKTPARADLLSAYMSRIAA